MVALGFFIVFLTFRENSFASGTIDLWENQRVVATGVYAAVRHPMYAGALLMLCGTPLALGSLWSFAGVALLAAALVWRIFDEERFLAKRPAGLSRVPHEGSLPARARASGDGRARCREGPALDVA